MRLKSRTSDKTLLKSVFQIFDENPPEHTPRTNILGHFFHLPHSIKFVKEFCINLSHFTHSVYIQQNISSCHKSHYYLIKFLIDRPSNFFSTDGGFGVLLFVDLNIFFLLCIYKTGSDINLRAHQIERIYRKFKTNFIKPVMNFS